MGASDQFAIRYDRWCGWLLGGLGMGRSRSHVVVGADTVVVRMGWAFRAEIPRASIVEVELPDWRGRWYLGWGVHGWRGNWLVNGSLDGLVSIALDPPVPSRVIGVPVSLRLLTVSLVEPEAFVERVTAL